MRLYWIWFLLGTIGNLSIATATSADEHYIASFARNFKLLLKRSASPGASSKQIPTKSRQSTSQTNSKPAQTQSPASLGTGAIAIAGSGPSQGRAQSDSSISISSIETSPARHPQSNENARGGTQRDPVTTFAAPPPHTATRHLSKEDQKVYRAARAAKHAEKSKESSRVRREQLKAETGYAKTERVRMLRAIREGKVQDAWEWEQRKKDRQSQGDTASSMRSPYRGRPAKRPLHEATSSPTQETNAATQTVKSPPPTGQEQNPPSVNTLPYLQPLAQPPPAASRYGGQSQPLPPPISIHQQTHSSLRNPLATLVNSPQSQGYLVPHPLQRSQTAPQSQLLSPLRVQAQDAAAQQWARLTGDNYVPQPGTQQPARPSSLQQPPVFPQRNPIQQSAQQIQPSAGPPYRQTSDSIVSQFRGQNLAHRGSDAEVLSKVLEGWASESPESR